MTPEFTSVPTVPIRRPRHAMPMVVKMDLVESAEAPIRARSMTEAYSGAWKFSAALAMGGENSAIKMIEAQPAKKEASAAMHKAGPARPLRAMGWPSIQMTRDDGSPGMLSMMAVVDPE